MDYKEELEQEEVKLTIKERYPQFQEDVLVKLKHHKNTQPMVVLFWNRLDEVCCQYLDGSGEWDSFHPAALEITN